MSDVEAIRSQLRAVVDELDDAILSALREAAAEGADKRPERERRLTRARNAVEKAIQLLDD